ncbi:methyltransferase domain-containing protein [Candidatus Woesearchaeota archaeon]|nr:methyltransferase domain-containing protein [Candidatus Woesearchaeota archaeon]
MDEKQETRLAYEQYADVFEQKAASYLERYIKDDANQFLSLLPGRRVLDVGCGPGRDLEFFSRSGMAAVGVDNAQSMVDKCHGKGFRVYQMDLEHLTFEPDSFDGVWAYASLLHVPKCRFPSTLQEMMRVLDEEGIFYLGMKEGVGEVMKPSAGMGGQRRLFSFYSRQELETVLDQWCEILHFSSTVPASDDVFLNFLCRKKKVMTK